MPLDIPKSLKFEKSSPRYGRGNVRCSSRTHRTRRHFACRYVSEPCEVLVGVTNCGWTLLQAWQRCDAGDTLLESAAVSADGSMRPRLEREPRSSGTCVGLESHLPQPSVVRSLFINPLLAYTRASQRPWMGVFALSDSRGSSLHKEHYPSASTSGSRADFKSHPSLRPSPLRPWSPQPACHS